MQNKKQPAQLSPDEVNSHTFRLGAFTDPALFSIWSVSSGLSVVLKRPPCTCRHKPPGTMHALQGMRTAPGLLPNRTVPLHAEHQQAWSSRPLKKAKLALHRCSNVPTQHCPASLKAQAVAEAPASIDVTEAPLQQPGLGQQQVSPLDAVRLGFRQC